MFGVGIAHQIISAERKNITFSASYFRRLAGLIVIGIQHVTFAFVGDILIAYGVLGIFLYFFRNKSQKTLIRTGIAMIILQVVFALLFAILLYFAQTYATADMVASRTEMDAARQLTTQVFSTGSFSEVARLRWSEWLTTMMFIAPLQAPGAFAFFLFGLAALRSGVINNPAAPLWSKSRRIYLPIGILLSLLGAYLTVGSQEAISASGLLGLAVLLLAAPLSSLGYIGLIAKWSEGTTTICKTFVARGGTASLTAYLFQSLVLSLVFCGYGLGYYQKLDALTCIALALFTGVFSLVIVSLIRKKYQSGPLEYILRKWTYLR